jgi:hypothetical protein
MPADVEQRASCVIQIDGDNVSFSPMSYRVAQGPRFDAMTAAWLLSSTALGEPAVETSLEQKPGLLGRQVLVAAAPSGNRFLRLEVSLKKAEKPWPSGAANRLLPALVDRLRAAAKESQKAENAALAVRLAAVTEQLAAAKARKQEIDESLQGVRDVLGYQGDYYGADSTGVLRRVKLEKARIESELVRLKARLAVVEDQPTAGYEAKVKAAEKALAKVIDDAKRGQAAAEAIEEAATNLADAKEKLATARAQAASSGFPRRHNFGEPESLRTSVAEQEERLKPLREQLAKLEAPGMAAKLTGYREQQQEEQRLQGEIVSLSESVRALQQAIRDRASATFTILDGNPSPEASPGASK